MLQGKWIFWQVLFPILLPVIVSALLALLWLTGDTKLDFRLEIILDVSPWALIYYSLTLIGSTAHDHIGKISRHVALFVSLAIVTIFVSIYAGDILIWRLNNVAFPASRVYIVTGILLIASIVLCHEVSRRP